MGVWVLGYVSVSIYMLLVHLLIYAYISVLVHMDYQYIYTYKHNKYFVLHHIQYRFLSSVQSLSCVRLFATPWTAAYQASLSITNSGSLLNFMSIESVIDLQFALKKLFHILNIYFVFKYSLRMHFYRFCNIRYSKSMGLL